jgi:hypothetical protein
MYDMWFIPMVFFPWLPTHPKAAAACIGGHCSGQPEPGPGGAGRVAGTLGIKAQVGRGATHITGL